jgi:hypothetical protein
MRRTVMVIGVVILVIGIALIAIIPLGGISGVNRINTFNEPKAGEYVSSELVLNGISIVAVVSPASVGGMIPSQDISSINSANVGTYAVPYTRAVNNIETYNGLSG